MGTILKWLQISDIHFNENGYGSQEVRDSFFDHYSKEKFDLLFITGDMAYQANYGDAAHKIKSLMTAVGCDESRTFIVPGNHDFRRSDARTDTIRKMKNIDNPTASDWDVFAHGATPYQDFCEDVLGREYAKQCLEPCVVKHVDGLPIDVILWNTCLMSCDGSDEHKLKICCTSLQEEMTKTNKSNLQIILGHHGLSFFDRSDYNKLETQIKRNTTTKLYLCGHSHGLGVNITDSITQVTCGSMLRSEGDNRGYDCGCIEGEINTDTMTISGCLMTYVNNDWQPAMDAVQEKRVFSVTNQQIARANPPTEVKKTGSWPEDGTLFEYNSSILGQKEMIGSLFMAAPTYYRMGNPITEMKRRLATTYQPLWRSCFGEKGEDEGVLFADKIYYLYLHDAKYPFLQHLPLRMAKGQVDQTDAARWWGMLEDITGTPCVPTDMVFDPCDLYADFIQPIMHHLQQIKEATAGYLVHPEYITDDETIYGQLISLHTMIQKNEKSFALREDEVATVNKYRTENKPIYLLWIGNEGYGKTMFACHLLSECTASQKDDTKQGKAAQAAPWLPQCVCVFCKNVQNADKALALLMAQINACLVYQIMYEPSDSMHTTVMAGLTQFAHENGQVLLIVDALDELATGKGFLQFLPPILPEDVIGILTSREGSAVSIATSELATVVECKMPIFRRKEIARLLGADKDSRLEAFANEVSRRTNGIPILVQHVVSQYQRNLAVGITDTSKVDIENTIVTHFSKLRMRWESNRVLKQILKLLVLAAGAKFEIKVDMDLLLTWVRMVNENASIDSGDILLELEQVNDQIEQPEPGCYMLKYKALSDTMTSSGGYPKTEWNGILQRLFDGYMKGDIQTSKAIGLFVAGRLPQYKHANWEAIGDQFLEEIVTRNDDIGMKMMCQMPPILALSSVPPETFEKKGKKRLSIEIDNEISFPSFVCRAVEIGMEQQIEGSCHSFYQKNVAGVDEDISHALQKIEQAASAGWLEAIQVLYQHYASKEHSDGTKAMQYFEDAIKQGDDTARFQLAVMLADPEGQWKDSEKAVSVLLSGRLDDESETLLGYLYAFFWKDDSMKGDGIFRLQHAWENGCDDAGFFLSIAQLDSSDESVQQEGVQRLKQLAKKEHVNSLVKVGSLEIEGKYGFHNRTKGRKYLKKACEIAHDADIAFRCYSILRKSKEKGDMEEAYRYLREASEDMPKAKYILADAILDCKTTGTELEAMRMLNECAEVGYDDVIILLAKFALLGKHGLERDYEKCRETIVNYARKYNSFALTTMTNLYQQGQCLISRADFIQLLEDADHEGNMYAPRYLYLVAYVETSYEERQALLSRGMERGDDAAKVLYIMNRLMNHELTDEEAKEAVEELKVLSQNAEETASWALFLIYRGDIKEYTDTNLAQEYLALAAEQEYSEAMAILGSQLLSSSKSIDKRRGQQYIDKADQQTMMIDGGKVKAALTAYKEQDYVLAASLFYDASQMGSAQAINNLAYMVRRGEANAYKEKVNVLTLLNRQEVASGTLPYQILSRINLFLCYFVGVDCAQDFDKAHDTLTSLIQQYRHESIKEHAEWWFALAEAGDAEGCLVAIVFHQFEINPLSSDVLSKYTRIAKSVYCMPEWLTC